MSNTTGAAPKKRKNSKTDDSAYSTDEEPAAPNEEEEEENADTDSNDSSQEYEVFDSSPEPKKGKKRKNPQSETNDPETPKRPTNRMRRNAKSLDFAKVETQTDSDSSAKPPKKKPATPPPPEIEKEEEQSPPPPDTPKRSESKRLILLLEELKSAVIQLECEYDPPSLATYIIENFLFSGQCQMEDIVQCFYQFYDEFKRFLQALSLGSSFNELYEHVRSLEIQSLSLPEGDPVLMSIQEFIQKIEKIRSPLSALEPFEVPVNIIRSLLDITAETPIANTIVKISEKIIPISLLLNSVNITNTIIHNLNSQENAFEILTMEIPEYNNIELQPYESSILPTYQPNPYYVNHCLELIADLESKGIVMTSSEIKSDNNSLVKIVAPNITKELASLHASLQKIAEEHDNEEMKNLAEDISQKPITIVQLFILEKQLTIANVQNPTQSLKDSIRILHYFRILHSLYLILDSEELVSYSNAVHLTYFRTFAANIAKQDMLLNQPLLSPIDFEVLVQIALQTTQRVDAGLIDQRIQLMIWLYLASSDVFCVGFEKADDSFESYLKWFIVLTTLQPETATKKIIEKAIEGLPPFPEFSDKLRSFLVESPIELPNDSTIVHLEIIFKAELSDTCINYQAALINQIRTTSYLSQYRRMLKLAVDDKFIIVPEGFSMSDDIKSFNEHHWDLTFTDILPFLQNLSEFLPPLSKSTIDLHICYAYIHSGYITYENVAKFGQVSLKHRKDFRDPESFVREIKKLSRFVLFLELHDQLVSAHALASDPPFSMLRNINTQILCRIIANQLLILNTASVFEPSRSKEIAVEAVLLRLIADAIKPALRYNPKVRERLANCLNNISTFFDNPAYGLNGLLNQIRINFALNEIEKDDLKVYMERAMAAFDNLETSVRRNQEIIVPYFELIDVLQQIKKLHPGEAEQIDYILSSLKFVTIIAQIRETMITAGNGDHPFNCIYPVPIKDKMGEKVPVISSIQALMVNKQHFPIPDRPLPASKQKEMLKLLQSLQEERDHMVNDMNVLQQYSERNKNLQREIAELFERRKLLIDNFNANREEMKKLLAEAAECKSRNEQRPLVIDGNKVSPEELKIEIDHNHQKSSAIHEQIHLIESKLKCYASSIKSSIDEMKDIEKDIIDIQIQKSVAQQKSRSSIEMKLAMEKEDDGFITETETADQLSEGLIDPSLRQLMPHWLHVPERTLKKIEKGMEELSTASEQAKEIKMKISNGKSDSNCGKGAEVSEIRKLAEEVKQIRKRRDLLFKFLQKSKNAIESLLSKV